MTRRLTLGALATTLTAALCLGGAVSAGAADKPAGDIMNDAPQDPAFVHAPAPNKSAKTGWRPDPVIFNTGDGSTNRQRQLRQSLPRRFDLRETRRVSPIRDQGPNGSCWAFAAMGALESYLRPNENPDFSEANMRNTHGFDWGPQDGGNRAMATAYLARGSGPIAEADDPYSPYRFNSPQGLTRAKDLVSALYIPDQRNGRDTANIKQAIMTYGAVSTVINGDESAMNWRTAAHYNSGWGYANHAVDIVGWIDDYSAANFSRRPAGDGAWIVRNSWGANWGDRGYYYVSYYDAHIGHENVVYTARPYDPNRQIYQYDPLGATQAIGNGGDGWFANVFTASNHQQSVNGVGFYAMSSDVSYDVYVVPNVSSARDLASGTKVASGRFDFAGYQTVNFSPVAVKPGSQFAAVVHVKSASYSYVVPIEEPERGFSSRARAGAGQSFVSSNGSSWDDLTRSRYNANVALKVMTTTNPSAPTPTPDPNPQPTPTPDPNPQPTPTPTPTPTPAPEPDPEPEVNQDVWMQVQVSPSESVRYGTTMAFDILVLDKATRSRPIANQFVYYTLTRSDGYRIQASGYTGQNGRLRFISPGSLQTVLGWYGVQVVAQEQGQTPAVVNFNYQVWY